MNNEQAPKHGGDIVAASHEYGIALDRWLDLSTGINPDSYPVPEIPQRYFHHLPACHDQTLLKAARAYYQVENLLAAAGSQAFIEALPTLREPCRVAIPDIGYQEHRWHWQRCGHQVELYSGFDLESLDKKIRQDEVDCAVVINPNNPTTEQATVEQLEQWRSLLNARNGWLIIDEAFIDTQLDQSFSPYSARPGVIVLRSIGKFFGLAGIRMGFALADQAFLATLSSRLMLWSVSGVSQFVAAQALLDTVWQQQARQHLVANSEWLVSALRMFFPAQTILKNDFFVSVILDKILADTIANHFAQGGVLIRQWPLPCDEKTLLRFGLLSGSEPKQRCLKLLRTIDAQYGLPV